MIYKFKWPRVNSMRKFFHLTCEIHMELEHFHIWNSHSRYEIRAFSRMKCLIHMWNELVENFTCGVLVNETSVSHRKKFTYEILFSHGKFTGKFFTREPFSVRTRLYEFVLANARRFFYSKSKSKFDDINPSQPHRNPNPYHFQLKSGASTYE